MGLGFASQVDEQLVYSTFQSFSSVKKPNTLSQLLRERFQHPGFISSIRQRIARDFVLPGNADTLLFESV